MTSSIKKPKSLEELLELWSDHVDWQDGEEMARRLRRVAELHRPLNDWCWHCEAIGPCPTYRALQGEGE
jgi:hypothetical protein